MVVIRHLFSDYFQFDVITNVKRIETFPIIFPAVTICTRHSINFTSSIKDSITSVSFGGKELNISEDLEYFKILYEGNMGDCMRFNGFRKNKDFKVTNSETDKFLVEFAKIDLITFVSFNNYENSFINTTQNFIQLIHDITGIHYEMKISEKEKQLGEPYNKCNFYPYTHKNCIEKCINAEIIKKYNCSILGYYNLDTLKGCYSFLSTDTSFLTQELTLFNEFHSYCFNRCPLKNCETTRFDLAILKSKGLIGLQQFHSFKVIDNNPLEIIQIPKGSGYSLVSNIGGTFGVFLGISFLSFFEIIELIIEFFFIIFITKNN